MGAFCIGVNQIDLPAASQRGIAAFNAPFSNTRSVVELALAEIIALTRRLTDKNAQMHHGKWEESATGSHEVRGRVLGIVGFGNVGGQLSVLAENLGMTVFCYDTADKLALATSKASCSVRVRTPAMCSPTSPPSTPTTRSAAFARWTSRSGSAPRPTRTAVRPASRGCWDRGRGGRG